MAKTAKSEKIQKSEKTQKSVKTLGLVKSNKAAGDTKAKKIGSARGIESMFRNSYRAQLDMIALAAMKANIMISLNGVLISMLLISGAYFLGSDPLLLIPVVVFLLTCTTAIFFAVLAARPDVNKTVNTLHDFRSDKAKLLIFDQFAKLSSEEFDTAMSEMMQSNERIYANMTAHIYSLGCTADKKFHRLYLSYNAFIVGLVLSVAALAGVVFFHVATKTV